MKIVSLALAVFFLISVSACAGIVIKEEAALDCLCNAASCQPAVVSVTFAALKTIADNTALRPGQKYRITDFRTRHTIPFTAEINTGPIEVLVVTALTARTLAPVAYSESYPQDIIEYELVNSLSDPAYDRGRILYRRDTQKNISSYEDWRSVKYRRGLNQVTGRFTEISDFSKGYVDRLPFNNSNDPVAVNMVHIGRTFGSELSNIVIGTGASSETQDVRIGQWCTRMTIGDNTSTIEIAHSNGTITIGDNSTHIRIGVCSDFAMIGNWCSSINIGDSSSWITVTDNTSNSNVGDNVGGLTIGDGTGMRDLYIGNGVYIDPPPIIRASGTLERNISTIPATIDITCLTDLNLANVKYAGIITLTSKNPFESLRSILKKPDPRGNDFPLELRPAAGLTLVIVGTPPDALATDGLIVLKGTVTLSGDKGDSIILKRKTIGKKSVFVEVSRSVL